MALKRFNQIGWWVGGFRKQIEDIIMNHHKFTESPDSLVDAMRKAVARLQTFCF